MSATETVRMILLSLMLGLAAGITQAMSAPVTVGDITVGGAWARPTIGASKQGVIYLTISNAGTTADRLLKLSTPAAAAAELHKMTMEGGMMKMRAVDAITIPAGASVVFAPSGDHIMLMGVAAPLHKGDSFTLTLSFDRAGDMDLAVPVLDAPPEPMAH